MPYFVTMLESSTCSECSVRCVGTCSSPTTATMAADRGCHCSALSWTYGYSLDTFLRTVEFSSSQLLFRIDSVSTTWSATSGCWSLYISSLLFHKPVVWWFLPFFLISRYRYRNLAPWHVSPGTSLSRWPVIRTPRFPGQLVLYTESLSLITSCQCCFYSTNLNFLQLALRWSGRPNVP